MTAEVWHKDESLQRDTMLIEGPLRGGAKIEFDGNVVVMGDVNAGAEIRASGHVIIFGSLRGMVHGGKDGDRGVRVAALSLFPTQLRIADHITCPPEGYTPADHRGPEVASLQGNKVVIETLAI